MEKAFYPDAVRFIAHALPKREAVWWGWVCARRSAGEKPPPKIKAALDATEKWIAQPTEDNRGWRWRPPKRRNWARRQDARGWRLFSAATAWRRPRRRAVPPGEFLAAKAVSGAVIFAAVAKEPERAPEKFRSFVAQGVEVTNRVKLWEPEV